MAKVVQPVDINMQQSSAIIWRICSIIAMYISHQSVQSPQPAIWACMLLCLMTYIHAHVTNSIFCGDAMLIVWFMSVDIQLHVCNAVIVLPRWLLACNCLYCFKLCRRRYLWQVTARQFKLLFPQFTIAASSNSLSITCDSSLYMFIGSIWSYSLTSQYYIDAVAPPIASMQLHPSWFRSLI